jgi:hypothetical protein
MSAAKRARRIVTAMPDTLPLRDDTDRLDALQEAVATFARLAAAGDSASACQLARNLTSSTKRVLDEPTRHAVLDAVGIGNILR